MFWHHCRIHGKLNCSCFTSNFKFSNVGNTPTFPRINVQDPYRRLGVSRDASEKEIWSSRNFLLAQYAPHERSAESIELAFEKLLMDSFIRTKKRKINLKSMLKKQVQESPPWFKNLLGFVEVPPTVIILRRLFLFAFIAGWSIMNSAETGPAFQVIFTLLFYVNLSFLGSQLSGHQASALFTFHCSFSQN